MYTTKVLILGFTSKQIQCFFVFLIDFLRKIYISRVWKGNLSLKCLPQSCFAYAIILVSSCLSKSEPFNKTDGAFHWEKSLCLFFLTDGSDKQPTWLHRCNTQGINVDDHFRDLTKMVQLGSGAQSAHEEKLLEKNTKNIVMGPIMTLTWWLLMHWFCDRSIFVKLFQAFDKKLSP